jgi:hypothetical protein
MAGMGKLTMRSSRFHLPAGMLGAAFNIYLLAGCATNHEPQPERLSSDEFRFFYPRQHYDSLSPSGQEEAERREAEKAWRRENPNGQK